MAQQSAAGTVAPPTLEVRRTIRAPRQRVFDAWTNPEEMKRWHAPGPLTVDLAEADLTPGGHWCVHMRQPDGVQHRASGVYRDIDPPKRVVYTFAWDGGTFAESVVTVEFFERGAATEVVLRQDGLPSDEERGKHEHGWIGCFDKIEALFT